MSEIHVSVDSAKPDDQPLVDPEQWVDLFGDDLFRYAMLRLRDHNAAEEVVQETFLAGLKAVDQYSGSGSQRSWLLAILRNKILDYVRKRAKMKESSHSHHSDPADLLFDQNGQFKATGLPAMAQAVDFEASELFSVVQECLKQIPSIYADVFVLRVLEEMSAADIGAELGISGTNVGVRLHRARLGLAKCVGNKWSKMQGKR